MNKKSLMTHIVGAYPDMKASEELVLQMDQAGVSFVEIQIPFSDPIADGPTIMQANQDALDAGVTPEDCFNLMERLKEKVKLPLLFMTYFNVVHHYGVESFCKRAHKAGAYGLIVPDMPLDEEPYDHFLEHCKKYDLHPIQVISPLTPDRRLKKIAEVASGFVYCVARKGTTGVQAEISTSLGDYLENVRKFISLPLAVGFGISSKEQVEQVLEHADIAVMGSKVIKLLNEGQTEKEIGDWLKNVIS
jgi:tryptophan synthase alpha chain